jgi:hypothetical protein
MSFDNFVLVAFCGRSGMRRPLAPVEPTHGVSADEVETRWTDPHFRGPSRLERTENTTLPTCWSTDAGPDDRREVLRRTVHPPSHDAHGSVPPNGALR